MGESMLFITPTCNLIDLVASVIAGLIMYTQLVLMLSTCSLSLVGFDLILDVFNQQIYKETMRILQEMAYSN